ncbi:hypothetical protein SAMN04488109_0634 [Chryseolinea serpens]|jgi:hypothetical protein|uniref:LTXXQ motif family protein n=1 Tax=Chryseolinea serpens TaxID=947013 RepID=A0A1M5KIA7_9BACT|nr:hypothetical protein [Chryseolinea serpens]SHG51933.1 hypothetical protein SAMN04488109_0634 [Chryseolinea serpens]
MKAILGILLTIILLPAWAQDEDIPPVTDTKARDKIQAARVAYITDQLQLTPQEAEKFWPIYREFAERRKALRQQLKQAKQNPSPDQNQEQNSQAALDAQFKIKQQELDLEKDYSGRLLKVISAQKLRTLPDAERRFRQMILDQIQRRQMQQERRQNLRDQQQQRLQQRNN